MFIDRQLPSVRAIGMPKRADGVAIRRSQTDAMPSPPPTQKPRIAATVGTSTSSSRLTIRAIFSSYATPSSPSEKSLNWLMSVPATNALSPAP